MDKSEPAGKNPQRVGKSSLGAIGILVLVGAYSLVQPELNARFGWNLPQLRSDDAGEVAVVAEPKFEPKKSPQSQSPSPSPSTPQPESTSQSESKPASESESELKYGLLREVSADRYLSPAGLQYTPGSAEGHRLEHLRRHTKDDPSRPGSHGVFDGEMEGALKTIDRAYLKAKQGTKTTTRVDDGRTIYTVDLGSRIGFVGGRDGARKRNPMARRVRIVLEGTRVITAYPL
ncbi:hypothetical protein [Novipirellula sp.]|uniref:hypothetical protein n=1 Tax=Novipirellula sp. TaxID=2795430 RepID=UPI0035655370